MAGLRSPSSQGIPSIRLTNVDGWVRGAVGKDDACLSSRLLLCICICVCHVCFFCACRSLWCIGSSVQSIDRSARTKTKTHSESATFYRRVQDLFGIGSEPKENTVWSLFRVCMCLSAQGTFCEVPAHLLFSVSLTPFLSSSLPPSLPSCLPAFLLSYLSPSPSLLVFLSPPHSRELH